MTYGNALASDDSQWQEELYSIVRELSLSEFVWSESIRQETQYVAQESARLPQSVVTMLFTADFDRSSFRG